MFCLYENRRHHTSFWKLTVTLMKRQNNLDKYWWGYKNYLASLLSFFFLPFLSLRHSDLDVYIMTVFPFFPPSHLFGITCKINMSGIGENLVIGGWTIGFTCLRPSLVFWKLTGLKKKICMLVRSCWRKLCHYKVVLASTTCKDWDHRHGTKWRYHILLLYVNHFISIVISFYWQQSLISLSK